MMLYFISILFIFYLPFQVALNPAPGIDLASGRVLAILIFLFWLALSLKNKKIRINHDLLAILILSFIFLSLFSIIFAQNQIWAWKKMLFLLSFFPLYFVFSDLAGNEEKSRRIIYYLVFGGFLASLTALVQFSLQFIIGLDAALNLWRKIIPAFLGSSFSQSVLEYSSWLVNIGGKNYFRAIAFFPDPHMFSLFLGLIFPWSVMQAVEKIKSPSNNKLSAWIVPAVILLADILTFSRGGYLGLIGGTIFISFWFLKKFSKEYLIYGGLFLLLGSALWFIPNPLAQRLSTSSNLREGSNQERIKNWSQAMDTVRENPVLGTGLGNYPLAVKPTATEREPIYAHNLFLDISAETGILNGMIFFLMLSLAIGSFIINSKYDTFYLGGAWGLAIFFFHSLFETGLYSVQVLPILIIILALSSSLHNYDSKNN